MVKKLIIISCITTSILTFSGCAVIDVDVETEASIEAEVNTETEIATEAETEVKAMAITETSKFALRVNCAAYDPYTDKAGNLWLPDQYFEGDNTWGVVDGMTVDRGELDITDSDAPKIYETECYMMSAYKFKVPNGKYTVRLHFAETYDGIMDEGERVFSVKINDKVVLEDFDPYKEAGFQKPLIKEFKGVMISNNEELVIGFESNIENPEVNGIEILSE
jgi:endoglucanase